MTTLHDYTNLGHDSRFTIVSNSQADSAQFMKTPSDS